MATTPQTSHNPTDNVSTMKSILPQHLVVSDQFCTDAASMAPTAPSARVRRLASSGVVALALPCLLLAAVPTGRALSVSSTSSVASNNVRSLVDQARMIREFKSGNGLGDGSRRRVSMDDSFAKQRLDSDTLSAALFDDDFNNSLESAVANLKQGKNGVTSAKRRAEEFDRFMEEDASVASIVQENIRPGSLVDAVQQCKGADIVDMEILLQREAADQRRSREQTGGVSAKGKDANPASAVSSTPTIKTTRKTKIASKSRSSPERATKPSKNSALLTKKQEYALAYTIQGGARVYKLKAEYESSNSQPLTKRHWAQLAGLSSNDLRKLVSDYRTAKQELVSSNLGLVHAVVRSYYRRARYRGMPIDELTQEGTLGLIRAAELFDPAKGLRFSTYATIWIKGVLSNSNSLEDVIRLPNRERTLWNKVRAAWEEMAKESGQDMTNGRGKPSPSASKELAARLGMKPSVIEEHLRRMSCVTNVLSLDYQYTSATRSGYADGKQDALMNSAQFGTEADLAEQTQFKADVVTALVRNLAERELTLMRLRYGLEDGTEYTIKECASKMGINRETARLLQHACLKKLREASNMESLQEYLLTVA